LPWKTFSSHIIREEVHVRILYSANSSTSKNPSVTLDDVDKSGEISDVGLGRFESTADVYSRSTPSDRDVDVVRAACGAGFAAGAEQMHAFISGFSIPVRHFTIPSIDIEMWLDGTEEQRPA
jgi:hypothetical protein